MWTSSAVVDTSQSASSEADLASRYRSLANDGKWLGAGSGSREFFCILPTVNMQKSMSGLELAA